MSWSSRRRVLLGAGAALLPGCGFAPAYGPAGGAAALQGRVLVEAPDTRAGFLLTRALESRLGRGGDARYALGHAIDLRQDAIAISDDNVTLRSNLLGRVTYALRDLDTGAVLRSGRVESFTGFSASGTTVATEAAQRDAEARLMAILADRIVTRLVAAAADLPA